MKNLKNNLVLDKKYDLSRMESEDQLRINMQPVKVVEQD